MASNSGNGGKTGDAAAASPPPAPGDPGARLLVRIGDFIEPLTRFDRNHLMMSESRHEAIQLMARQTFKVSFETGWRQGNGALPAGVETVADSALLERETIAQKDAARALVPGKLAQWAEAHGEDLLDKLAVEDCFLQLPPLGVVEACAGCEGSGRVDCETCAGAGATTCKACEGKGSEDCEACGRTGAVTCQTCKGAGTILEQGKKKVWDDAIGQERIETTQEIGACAVCDRKGAVTCRRCEGKGQITCATCEGKTTVPCRSCDATGRKTCPACAGEGNRHRIAELSCSITEAFEISPRTADADIARVLKSRTGMEDVLRLSTDRHTTTETNADTLRRDTLAIAPVTSALISVGEQQRALIRGYGPDQEVLDYRNLAGMLLVGDMVQLDSAIAMTSLMPPKVNDAIFDALSNVLASEANVTIASETGKKSPADLERDFRGVVTAEYIKRAGAGIRTALGRAYWAGIARRPALGLLLPVFFGPLDLLLRGSGAGARIGLLLAIVLATFGICAVGHVLVVRGLQKRVAPQGWPKVGAIIGQIGPARIWLIGSAAAAFLLTLLVAGMTSWLFPSR